ncbi:MAG: hypothetical protein ACR2PG_02440 [Hyphomicrobiaceae bacterium]
MENAQSEQARGAAAKELLDRGYGKSTQHGEQQYEGEIVIQVITNVPRAEETKIIDTVPEIDRVSRRPATIHDHANGVV